MIKIFKKKWCSLLTKATKKVTRTMVVRVK